MDVDIISEAVMGHLFHPPRKLFSFFCMKFTIPCAQQCWANVVCAVTNRIGHITDKYYELVAGKIGQMFTFLSTKIYVIKKRVRLSYTC